MTLAVQPNPRLEYDCELRICVVQNLGVNICFPFYREVEIKAILVASTNHAHCKCRLVLRPYKAVGQTTSTLPSASST